MDEESRVGLGGFGPDSRLRLDGWRSEFDLVVGRAMRPDSVGTDKQQQRHEIT